jgi:hypothetical protein
MIMTQGALGHTGAQGRARGFESVVKKYPKIEVLDTQPADWDVTKVARIWETLLTKYPKISAAYFHNDDMALAAYNVMKTHNRTEILIGGCDAMPPALAAVTDGRMHATVRNPSCRIHGGAIDAQTPDLGVLRIGPDVLPGHGHLLNRTADKIVMITHIVNLNNWSRHLASAGTRKIVDLASSPPRFSGGTGLVRKTHVVCADEQSSRHRHTHPDRPRGARLDAGSVGGGGRRVAQRRGAMGDRAGWPGDYQPHPRRFGAGCGRRIPDERARQVRIRPGQQRR